MSGKNLDEAMGLLAHHEEAVDSYLNENSGKNLNDYLKLKNKALDDLFNSTKDNEILFLIWLVRDYPLFLDKALLKKRLPNTLPTLLKGERIKLNKLIKQTVAKSLESKLDKYFLNLAKRKLKGSTKEKVSKYIKNKINRESMTVLEKKLMENKDPKDSIISFILRLEINIENTTLIHN